MKRILCCILVIFTANTFATQARVESMGKRPAFFLDDITMFDNPANATFYSPSLMGELGFYEQSSLGPKDIGKNMDAFSPWFGALFKFGLSDKPDMRDPQITIGGFFGRDHYNFTRLVPRKVVVRGDTVPIPQSVTNFDAFLGGTMIDGSAVGAHVYVGIQDGKQDDPANPDPGRGKITPDAHVSILSMDYGANFLVTNTTSIELTLGVARIQYGPSRKTFLDPGLFSFYSQGRIFLDIDPIGGQLVSGYKWANMEVPGWQEDFYNLNVGVNVVIPRGFFWVGIDGVRVKEEVGTWDRIKEEKDEYLIYREPGSAEKYTNDLADHMGGILSFGVERNIWSNWLILRVGGQKALMYNTCRNSSGKTTICNTTSTKGQKVNYWSTNPYGDGTLDDHVGFGLGFNIDEKLKIDFSLSEDLLFRNPFQGGSKFLTRISSIYRF